MAARSAGGNPGRTSRGRRLRRAAGASLVLVVEAVALVPGGAAEDTWLPSQPIVEGQRLFETKGCGRCHGVWGGEGEPQIGPDLGRHRSWRDVMQLGGTLWNHTPPMMEKMQELRIERSTLSPEEMLRLASYLFYLNFFDEPADVEHGRQLFEERSCSRCHQLAGRGGTVGPRLDELRPYVSSLFLAQALWNHGPEMTSKMAELHLGRPRLEGDEVAHLVAFIRGSGAAAMTPEQVSAQAGSPRAGQAVFRGRGCARCHAIAGDGGAVGPDLGRQRPNRNVAEMAGMLWNHGPPMWAKMGELGVAFPRLTEREMSDLLAYLYFVQFTGENGDADAGARLFREKTCTHCHSIGGEGPAVGPDLAASKAAGSALRWASAMWNHAPAMAEKARESGLPWPRFEGNEMRDLVTFLRSRSEVR